MRLCRTWMSVLAMLGACSMAPLVGGCAGRGELESVESELRQREDMITELETRLAEMRTEEKVSKGEIQALRNQLSSRGSATLVAEQAAVLQKVEKVAFHSLLTSGKNTDDVRETDEVLCVLLMPLDGDGDLVKLPGGVELELLDLALPQDQQRIGRWTFTMEEARSHWHRGLTAAGYLFDDLKWDRAPVSRDVTIHGRLIAPDGRQFDTTSQVVLKVDKNARTNLANGPSTPLTDAQPPVRTAVHSATSGPGRQLVTPIPTTTSDRFPVNEIPQRR